MNEQVIKFAEAPVVECVESKLGNTSTKVEKYYVSDSVQAGVWCCKKGAFTIDAHAANEICHILEGTGAVTHPDGTICNFEAGDTLYIPKGTAMKWDVITDIKKIYMVAD
ncbi:cupin domain-containing protein [Desulforhopalus sp. 52FAK]